MKSNVIVAVLFLAVAGCKDNKTPAPKAAAPAPEAPKAEAPAEAPKAEAPAESPKAEEPAAPAAAPAEAPAAAPAEAPAAVPAEAPAAVPAEAPAAVPAEASAAEAPAAAIPAATCPSGTPAEDGMSRGCNDAAGVKQGIWRTYAADGQKELEGEYRDGKKAGVWTTFFQGKVDREETYENDELHGRSLTWRPNGEFRSAECRQNGKKVWTSTSEADKEKACP